MSAVLNIPVSLADSYFKPSSALTALNSAVYSVGDVLSTYVYRVGLVDMDYSFATAVGLFKNIIAFTLVNVVNAIAKRINEYSLW